MTQQFVRGMFTAICALVVADVQASVLRVKCPAAAEFRTQIYVNGILRGDCPVDVVIPAGTVKFEAHVDFGGKKGPVKYPREFQIAEGVAMRLVFGADLVDDEEEPPAPQPSAARASTAKQRYEAEVAEYESSVQACLPKFSIELNSLRQRIRPLYAAAVRECLNGVRLGGTATRADVEANTSFCQPRAFNDGVETWIGEHRDRPQEFIDFRDMKDMGAEIWCRRQFSKPVMPR